MYGNGGFEFTWFANPSTPDYFEVMAMEHGGCRAFSFVAHAISAARRLWHCCVKQGGVAAALAGVSMVASIPRGRA